MLSSPDQRRLCPACEQLLPPGTDFCPDDGAELLNEDGTDPLVGRVFSDRFEILERLGAGAMGTVYKARQLSVDRHVALKLLRRDLLENRTLVKRFLLEAKATSSLTSHHTVTIFDFGETSDGLLFIAMEYLVGCNLRDKLDHDGAVSVGEMATILDQITESLTEAHRADIVHRDLKPDNVFLAETPASREFVKVLDFGIARARTLQDGETMITRQGTMAGTPPYMAPEVINGGSADARADVYALGIMMYELLAGRCPYVGSSPITILMRHLQDEPPPIEVLNPAAQVPNAVYDLIWRCLSKDRELRPPDAAALRSHLRDALASGDHGINKMPRMRTSTGFNVDPHGHPTPLVDVDAGATLAAFDPQEIRTAETTNADMATLSGAPTGASSGARKWLIGGLAAAGVAALVAFAFVAGGSGETRDAGKARVSSPPAASPAASPAERAPDAVAVAASTSPTELELAAVDAVTAEVRSAPAEADETVAVTVISTPPGALVHLGSEELGPTPRIVRIAAGDALVSIRLSLTGHTDETFEVAGFGDQIVTRALTPIVGPKPAPTVRPRPRPTRPSTKPSAKPPSTATTPPATKPQPKPKPKPRDKIDVLLD